MNLPTEKLQSTDILTDTQSTTSNSTAKSDVPLRADNTWSGTSSTAWATGTNWSNGHAPLSTENAIIPGSLARYPIVSTTTALCNTLTLQASSSTLEIASGTLTITSTIANHGQIGLSNSHAILAVGTSCTNYSGSTMVTSVAYSPEVRIGGNFTVNSGATIHLYGGKLKFTGFGTNNLQTNADTYLHDLEIAGTNCTQAASTNPLIISDYLQIMSGSTFICNSNQTNIINGNISVDSGGACHFTTGTVSLQGNSNTIVSMKAYDYFNNLEIAKTTGYHVSLNANMTVNGNLTISSGSLAAGTNDIYIHGNWEDDVVGGFDGGVHTYFSGTTSQYIYSDESFTILDISNTTQWVVVYPYASITCGIFNDHGGNFDIQGSMTINDGNPFSGHLEVNGLLTYNAGTNVVNMTGEINVNTGHIIVNGGSSIEATFTNTGEVSISYGTIDFTSLGVFFANGLIINCISGTIRTSSNVDDQDTSTLLTGLTVEMYGNQDSHIIQASGASLYSLSINKASTYHVYLYNSIILKGSLSIVSGLFDADRFNLTIYGDWYDYVSGFVDAGYVNFAGNLSQHIYGTENFGVFHLDKTAMGLTVADSAWVTCSMFWRDLGDFSVDGFFSADVLNGTPFGGLIEVTGTCNFNAIGSPINITGYVSITSGGNFNINGGISPAVLASGGTLSMDFGYLSFNDVGVTINPGFTFDVVSGVLSTAGDLICNDIYLNLSTLEIELFGSSLSHVSLAAGARLFNLMINKTSASIDLDSSMLLNGILYVNSGIFMTNHHSITAYGGVVVSGMLDVGYDSALNLGNNASLLVSNRGQLYLSGIAGHPATVTCTGSAYSFTVASGGWIYAYYTNFSKMDVSGVNLQAGSSVWNYNDFNHCQFSQGASGGTLLTINNAQDIYIYDAQFPTNSWGGASNVTKTNTAGSVNLVMATGAFSGEAYDNDTNNLVNWSSTLPPFQHINIVYNHGTDQFNLSWAYPLSEVHFTLYYCPTPNGTYLPLYTNLTHSYVDVPAGTKCFYKVTASLP